MVENEEVLGVNVMEVAADAVVANELLIELFAQLLVPNIDPVIPLPETNNDPVITADPLKGNPVPDPALSAYEDVIEKDAVVGTNVILVAVDDVIANELLIALLAQLAVPNVDPLCVPMNEPVNDAVLICEEADTSAGLFATLLYST